MDIRPGLNRRSLRRNRHRRRPLVVLALLGFLPTVGGTNPVRFESDSILGMRIQSHWLPTTGQYLAYQRDTYTNVTGREICSSRRDARLPSSKP